MLWTRRGPSPAISPTLRTEPSQPLCHASICCLPRRRPPGGGGWAELGNLLQQCFLARRPLGSQKPLPPCGPESPCTPVFPAAPKTLSLSPTQQHPLFFRFQSIVALGGMFLAWARVPFQRERQRRGGCPAAWLACSQRSEPGQSGVAWSLTQNLNGKLSLSAVLASPCPGQLCAGPEETGSGVKSSDLAPPLSWVLGSH